MSHAYAFLTPTGSLRLAKCVVDDGWPRRRAAIDRFGVSVMTTKRWADRYRIGGMCVSRRLGPVRIAYRLELNPSTIAKDLARYGCPSWRSPTRRRVSGSRPAGARFAVMNALSPATWSMSPSKSWARSPTAAVTRYMAGPAGAKIKKGFKPGYAFIHNAVDDQSRLAYSEILADER